MKNFKSILIAFSLLLYSLGANAQTGTMGDPFTTLNQAANVTFGGIYYFDLGGNTFDTYVSSNGYVQVAIDFGDGAGILPDGNSLNTLTRGVLDSASLSSLDGIAEVRITSTTGNTDVVTSHDSIIWRVQNNMCLHRGWIDTAINQDWVGLNDTAFTTYPTVFCGPTPNSYTLAERVVHNCGAYDSFTWLPFYGYQREVWNNGEVLDATKFQLWVKGSQCTNAVTSTDVINSCTPITWIDGNTYSSSNNTATDTLTTVDGCDSIVTLDLTIDVADASVTQNGFQLTADVAGQTYQWLDCDNGFAPIAGEVNQSFNPTDNGNYAVAVSNGSCLDTSACYAVEGLGNEEFNSIEVLIYPNPVQNELNIQTEQQIQSLFITDPSGRIVYTSIPTSNPTIDLTDLPKGVYFLQIQTSAGNSSTRFVKK